MGKKSSTQKLNVFFRDQFIGHLTKQLNGAIEFEYDDQWVENGQPISLSLPLGKKKFKGEEAAFYFDNLLPDNKLIVKAIAEKFNAKSTKQFDILQAIGKDCVGALTFFDQDEEPEFQKKLKFRPITNKEIEKKISGLAYDSPLGMDERDFRISLAGAQEKMALLQYSGKWYEPQLQTPTSHIIKKAMDKILGGIDFSSSVDNEYTCLKMAQDFGIKTCEPTIEFFGKHRVLSVKRFDRVWKEKFLYRIPQEDMCQAMGRSPLQKYERKEGGPSLKDLMELLENSNNAHEDRKMLFKIALFNDLIYNTDGHAKNISIYVLKNGFALTPAYDLLSAHFLKYLDEKRYSELRSSWSVNQKFHYHEITIEDWKKEAKNCGLQEDIFQEICRELNSSINEMEDKAWHIEVNNEVLEQIKAGIIERQKALQLLT